MITVKVIEVPGTIKEVALNEPTTVADALSAAGMNIPESANLTRNGAPTTLSGALSDGDRVIISKGAKGA